MKICVLSGCTALIDRSSATRTSGFLCKFYVGQHKPVQLLALPPYLNLKAYLALLTLFTFSTCVSSSQGIDVTGGKGVARSTLTSFHIIADQIPAFLGPVIISNFSLAMAEPGDFMHTGRASVSFLEAFRELLADNPR